MNQVKTYSNKFGEFRNLRRIYNKASKKYVVTISTGGVYVTDQDEIITTVLGSCISTCIRDTKMGIGGMNHFLMPGDKLDLISMQNKSLLQLGAYSMDYLINTILENGGSRKNLEIKVFGGGAIISSVGNVGMSNIQFIRDYIEQSNYVLANEDLGGEHPRKVNYFVKTGAVMVKRLRALHKQVIVKNETDAH
ncbi:MAG: chemoreceptor glutamine deamidase CheD [Gammaproteobacteria bacterium]